MPRTTIDIPQTVRISDLVHGARVLGFAARDGFRPYGLDRRRWEMDYLACRIMASLRRVPADFDVREPLWARREELRSELLVRLH